MTEQEGSRSVSQASQRSFYRLVGLLSRALATVDMICSLAGDADHASGGVQHLHEQMNGSNGRGSNDRVSNPFSVQQDCCKTCVAKQQREIYG
jgi:hypothetical protein